MSFLFKIKKQNYEPKTILVFKLTLNQFFDSIHKKIIRLVRVELTVFASQMQYINQLCYNRIIFFRK